MAIRAPDGAKNKDIILNEKVLNDILMRKFFVFGCSSVKSLRELSSRCQVVPLGAKTALQGFTFKQPFPPCLFLFYYFQLSPQKLKKKD